MKHPVVRILPLGLWLLAACGGSGTPAPADDMASTGSGRGGGSFAGGSSGSGGSAGGGSGSAGGAVDLGRPPGDMIVILNGCPSLSGPVAMPGDDIGGDTWASYAQGFFATYCTRCHSSTLSGKARNGAPIGYNWDVQATVDSRATLIRSAVGTTNAMPPSAPSPTCAERFRISRWLDAGHP